MFVNYKELERETIERINIEFRHTEFDFRDNTTAQEQRQNLTDKIKSCLNMLEIINNSTADKTKLKELIKLIDTLYIKLLEGHLYFNSYRLKDLYTMFVEYVTDKDIKVSRGNILDWLYRDSKGKLMLISELKDTRPIEFR